MPSRNQPCPCGSGIKYKRCCLVRLEAVARELGDRDAFLGGLIAWLRSEHREDIEEAGSHTALIRMLRGITGRNMSMVWAINEYRPTDGGPPLICRYAARPELSEAERAIARELADARLDAYRVRSLVAGVWLELESLGDGTSVRVAWRDGLEQLDLGVVLLARVVRATSLPTLWGLGARFAAGGERRWRARLATQPNDPAQAGLAVLEFHPDDVAEPLPDTVELQAVKWSITNDEAVLDVLEHDDSWECLGQALPDGWAFAWPDGEEAGAIDLGGWRQRPGEIEAARLIVRTNHIVLLGTDPRLLRGIASHLKASLGERIAAPEELLAA